MDLRRMRLSILITEKWRTIFGYSFRRRAAPQRFILPHFRSNLNSILYYTYFYSLSPIISICLNYDYYFSRHANEFTTRSRLHDNFDNHRNFLVSNSSTKIPFYSHAGPSKANSVTFEMHLYKVIVWMLAVASRTMFH